MKKKILFVAIVILVAFSPSLKAQSSATLSDNPAKVLLIIPMGISKDLYDLNFGAVTLVTKTDGKMILSTDGSREPSGGINTSAIKPIATNPTFSVTGSKNLGYTVTLPSFFTVSGKEVPTSTMKIDALTVKFNGFNEISAVGATSVLDKDGNDSFKVGGTLNVTADNGGGEYEGIFPVTVDYN